MNEIGDILKQARIDKGITLYDIYEVTKIMPKYLEAIEKGDWDVLPGRAYAKGYIRSFADVVEVDGDYLVELFDSQLGEQVEHVPDNRQQSRRKDIRRSERLLRKMSSSESRKGWTVLLVGIMLLAVFIHFSPMWAPNNKKNDKSEQPPITQQPSEQESDPEPEPEPAPEVEQKPEPAPEPEPPLVELSLLEEKTNGAVYEIITDKEQFTATITISDGPCWVRIVTDDSETWENTMQAGSTHTVQATDKIAIRMGLPRHANIEVEDEAIPHIDSKSPYNCTIQR